PCCRVPGRRRCVHQSWPQPTKAQGIPQAQFIHHWHSVSAYHLAMSVTPWRAFVDVCRTGSITVSAEAMAFTQSACSRQPATPARAVWAPLPDALARAVRPARAGEAALPHARMLGDTFDRALRAVADAIELRQWAHGAVPSATMALVLTAMRR